VIVAGRNSTNSADLAYLANDGANHAFFGSNSALGQQFGSATLSASFDMFLRIGAATYQYLNAGLIEYGVPRVGLATPYASDGSFAITNRTDHVLTPAEYSRDILIFDAPGAGAVTYIFPLPADSDHSYCKDIITPTGNGASAILSVGVGNELSIGGLAGDLRGGRFAFTPAGVFRVAGTDNAFD
jgi:hypothetical protein